MKNRNLNLVLATLLLAVLVGCKEKATPATEGEAANANGLADSADTAAADLAKMPDPHDPCRLLEPKEVEAVLGKLAGAPYRGGNPNGDSGPTPDATGYYCWYSTAEGKNLTVQAEWTDAGAINAGVSANLEKAEKATKGMMKLQDGTELTGDWDEAKITGCCNFVAMQGDSSVEIEFGGSLTTTPEQAGELANKALARLTKPLDIDGQSGMKDAEKRMMTRYSSEDPCSLWSAADITKLLGTPKGEFERSGDDCTIRYTGKDGQVHLFVTTATLTNGYRGFRRDNATYGGFAKSINAENAEGGVALRDSKTIDGPWEAASDGPIQFNSVKHDAQISVRSNLSHDELRALLGHAYAGIAAGAQK